MWRLSQNRNDDDSILASAAPLSHEEAAFGSASPPMRALLRQVGQHAAEDSPLTELLFKTPPSREGPRQDGKTNFHWSIRTTPGSKSKQKLKPNFSCCWKHLPEGLVFHLTRLLGAHVLHKHSLFQQWQAGYFTFRKSPTIKFNWRKYQRFVFGAFIGSFSNM